MSEERPPVVVQEFCDEHRHDLIVRRLQLGHDEPWMVAELTAKIMMWQAAMASGRIKIRAGGDESPQAVSLVLAEIGCLACFEPEWYRACVRVLKKGVSHAAQVAQFKERDPDWPWGLPTTDSAGGAGVAP